MINLPSYDAFIAEHQAIQIQLDRLVKELSTQAHDLSKELESEYAHVDEIALSLALSAPTIIHYSGLFLKWLGHKHSNSNIVVKIGQALDLYGSKLQNAIYDVIRIAIKPLISNLSPSDQELAAKCLFASILATRLLAEFPTLSSIDSISTLAGKIEAAIATLETREIVSAIREIAPKLSMLARSFAQGS